MARPANHVGDRFGRLELVARAPNGLRSTVYWSCRCDCGEEAVVKAHNLQRGATTSCGCVRRELTAALRRKSVHGMTGTPTYITWMCMISRCENPGADNYKYYGGRGINVCDRWREDFCAFHADMGDRPADRTLDRINTNGHYEPGNCRWATRLEQAANKRPRERREASADRALEPVRDLFADEVRP